eukprot:1847664-Alexandrium_andersonii.AAC.1
MGVLALVGLPLAATVRDGTPAVGLLRLGVDRRVGGGLGRLLRRQPLASRVRPAAARGGLLSSGRCSRSARRLQAAVREAPERAAVLPLEAGEDGLPEPRRLQLQPEAR